MWNFGKCRNIYRKFLEEFFYENTLIKYLPWLFILIMIEPSFQRSTLHIFPAVVTFTFHTLFVILAITIWKEERFPYSRLLNILMLWIFICIIRGIFVSGNYWEYKSLSRYSLALLSSLGILVFMSPYRVIHCLRMYFKYIVPISVVALPFFHTWSWFWMYYVFFVMIIFYPIIYRKNLFLAITIFLPLSMLVQEVYLSKSAWHWVCHN